METPVVIDGYEYTEFITEELKNKLNSYLGHFQTKDRVEHFSLYYGFWYILKNELIKNMVEQNEEVCEKLAIIYNVKTNLEYQIINKLRDDEIEELKLKLSVLCNDQFFLSNEFCNIKKNIKCDVCDKDLYCRCHIYHKTIPFSLCRINKFFCDDCIIGEFKEEQQCCLKDQLIHFCSKKCESVHYIQNVSKIKKLN